LVLVFADDMDQRQEVSMKFQLQQTMIQR